MICEHARVTKIIAAREPMVEIDHERLYPRWVVVACTRGLTRRWITRQRSPVVSRSPAQLNHCGKRDRRIGTRRANSILHARPTLLVGTHGPTIRRMSIFRSGLAFGSRRNWKEPGTRFRAISSARFLRPHAHTQSGARRDSVLECVGGSDRLYRSTVPLLGAAPAVASGFLVAGAYAGHGVASGVRAGELLTNAIVRNEPLPEWQAEALNWRSNSA